MEDIQRDNILNASRGKTSDEPRNDHPFFPVISSTSLSLALKTFDCKYRLRWSLMSKRCLKRVSISVSFKPFLSRFKIRHASSRVIALGPSSRALIFRSFSAACCDALISSRMVRTTLLAITRAVEVMRVINNFAIFEKHLGFGSYACERGFVWVFFGDTEDFLTGFALADMGNNRRSGLACPRQREFVVNEKKRSRLRFIGPPRVEKYRASMLSCCEFLCFENFLGLFFEKN